MLGEVKKLTTYRLMIGISGGAYLLWWFAVNSLFPDAFNPLGSRLVVVFISLGTFALSYLSQTFFRQLRLFFIMTMGLITAHYYYLFYHNPDDVNWVVGCFITIMALSLGFTSASSLMGYSVFVILLSLYLVLHLPSLRQSFLLPGILTILVQANLVLRTRLKILTNLAASVDRFQLLFHSTFEGIIVHNNGTIINVNQSLINLLGFKRDEMIGQSILTIAHPEDKHLISDRMELPEMSPYEIRAITKEGALVDIEVRGKSFKYEGKNARLVTIQDITDRKKAEQEKIKALSMAENVRERDEFISIASHELKTPLSSLKLQCQLIERQLKTGSLQGAVTLFNRQIDRLTQLVETMLDVSRISTHQLFLHIQEVDFARNLRNLVMALQSTAETDPALPHIFLEAPEHLLIHGDPVRLDQVAENLINNAIKYGSEQIQIRLWAHNAILNLEVEDKGIGIPTDSLQKIFERFERIGSHKNISGLGLGLYITRKIVEAHGGNISVRSTLGTGSTFTVSLPIGYANPNIQNSQISI